MEGSKDKSEGTRHVKVFIVGGKSEAEKIQGREDATYDYKSSKGARDEDGRPSKEMKSLKQMIWFMEIILAIIAIIFVALRMGSLGRGAGVLGITSNALTILFCCGHFLLIAMGITELFPPQGSKFTLEMVKDILLLLLQASAFYSCFAITNKPGFPATCLFIQCLLLMASIGLSVNVRPAKIENLKKLITHKSKRSRGTRKSLTSGKLYQRC